MDLKRLWRHLAGGQGSVRRIFPQASLDAITAAVKLAETDHGGQVHVALEGALHAHQLLDGVTPRQRALELFAQLHVWDTARNNGVLIYVLLADRAVEIVADRDIHARAGDDVWRRIAHAMQSAFARGHFADGVLAGVAAVGTELARHYPVAADGRNELPDAPTVL